MASQRTSRSGLVWPFILFFLIVAAYTVFWFVVRGQFEKIADDWIAAEQANGATVEFSKKSVHGYPFRVTLTLDDAIYETADKTIRYEGEVTQLVMQPWNWQHIIARAPGRNVVTDGQGIRHVANLNGKSAGSVSWNKEGVVQRVGLQLDDADLLLNGNLFQTEDFSLNLSPRDTAPEDLMVAVQWNTLTLEGPPADAEWLGEEIQASRLIGEVRGFYPAYIETGGDTSRLLAALMDNSQIEIAQGLVNWGALKLGSKADVSFDSGVANGSVSLRIDDPEALKETLEENGKWTLAEQMVVTPLEASSADGGFLILSIKDNEVTFGGMTLFKLNMPTP